VLGAWKRLRQLRRDRKTAKLQREAAAAVVEPGLGKLGETLAGRHLEKGGLRILARNVQTPCGEIDIVAMDGKGPSAAVVFVEVKTRRKGGRRGTPEEAVTRDKADRLARAATAFLARSRNLQSKPCRFDVVAIEVPRGATAAEVTAKPALATVRWHRAAFDVSPRALRGC